MSDVDRSRAVNVVRGDRLIREIDEELESHVAEAIAQGRDPTEARAALGLRSGCAKRAGTSAWSSGSMTFSWTFATPREPWPATRVSHGGGAFAGARHRREPTIFSFIDAVMLRAIPVSDPQQLVQITRSYATGTGSAILDSIQPLSVRRSRSMARR